MLVRPRLHPTEWRYEHRDARGRLLWEQDWTPNLLTDAGEESMLRTYFRNDAIPPSFFVGLMTATPAEGLTLPPAGEPSAGGYARIEVARGTGTWTVAPDGGDAQATGSTVQFAGTGAGFGPVTAGFLATSADNSGILVVANALSQSRTLGDGDTLDVTVRVKLA